MTATIDRYEESFVLSGPEEKESFEKAVKDKVKEFSAESGTKARVKFRKQEDAEHLTGGEIVLAVVVLFAEPIAADIYKRFRKKVANFIETRSKLRR